MPILKKQAFTMAQLPPAPDPGEVVFVTNASTASYSWVVPPNVYRISAVCVSCFGVHTYPSISRGSTVLLSPNSTLGVGGVGGGNGGPLGRIDIQPVSSADVEDQASAAEPLRIDPNPMGAD